MRQSVTERDKLARDFQIRKFRVKRMVPTVSMQSSIDCSALLKKKNEWNARGGEVHITLTHCLLKAIANTLGEYPLCYAFFDGKKIIENDEVILNVPVDIENHVEYIVLRNPNQKSVKEIALECVTELKKIRNDSGSYMSLLRKMASMGKFRKFWFYFVELKGAIPFLRNYYGNFPVSNFGSFHIANGILALSSPMVAGLCIGELHGQNGRNAEPRVLTATLCFNHCVFDGNYGGRFLNALKNEIENGACFS